MPPITCWAVFNDSADKTFSVSSNCWLWTKPWSPRSPNKINSDRNKIRSPESIGALKITAIYVRRVNLADLWKIDWNYTVVKHADTFDSFGFFLLSLKARWNWSISLPGRSDLLIIFNDCAEVGFGWWLSARVGRHQQQWKFVLVINQFLLDVGYYVDRSFLLYQLKERWPWVIRYIDGSGLRLSMPHIRFSEWELVKFFRQK